MTSSRLVRSARLVALAAPLIAFAQGPAKDCFQEAAQRYSVDARLLRAIAKVESNFNPSAVHVNSDGTRDVGLMQINSSHFGELRSYGIGEATLLSQPCTNVAVGAWILAGFIRHHGLTWRAVGSYAAGSAREKEGARVAYATAVSRAIKHAEGVSDPVSAPAVAAVRRTQVVE